MTCKKLNRNITTSGPADDAAEIVEPPIAGQRLLSMREVQQLTTYSRSSLCRLIAARSFPAPLKLGATKIAFREFEVLSWLRSRPRAHGSSNMPWEVR